MRPQVPHRGRLAPSPTGELHLGHARTFLLAYWHAKSQGGHVVLRIEDVDAERASQEHVDQLRFDLEWLGLEWEGTPRLQSEGVPELRAAAMDLFERGLAYPCVCSRGDLRAAAVAQGSAEESGGAPQGTTVEFRYPGTCRGRFQSLEHAEATTGRPAGLRLRTEHGHVSFSDLLHGQVSADVQHHPGDFLILRRDKTPSYHLAVVVDDARDGVADVVRGEDLLGSTGRQVLLAGLLERPTLTYAHVPLVLDAQGVRLAKRDQAQSLALLRARGTSPRAVVAWAATSTGHLAEDVRELDLGELVSSFDLRRTPTSATMLQNRSFSAP